ncbi:MAG: S8 family serine peptidase [Candidatus Helarchaeota archaeon]|nr:S8 family serine peptidase [Candidatus Helarchaeota archaeon]
MTKNSRTPILLLICTLFIVSAFLPSAIGYLNNPNDDLLMQQWGWLRIYADVAYSNNYRGNPSTLVAVIDTGIDLNHPDLQANIYTNPGEVVGDGLDNDLNGYIDDIHGWNFVSDTNNTDDNDGHGTHVSGIIAAVSNAIGICGVAPNVKILPIKIIEFESGSLNVLADAIDYAVTMGADIISMSIGTDSPGPFEGVINIAITAAYLAGVVLVAAAGNDGLPSVSYPAWNSLVIAVAATNPANGHASYSNTGTEVDIAAPGGDSSGTIISTYKNESYRSMGGTSMACPHVSGAIALMLQWNSTLTPAEVWARLNETAIDLGTPGRDDEFGAGLVNIAGILDLPMEHTYNPTLDWILRNIWWIGLIGAVVILLIIYSTLKKKPQTYSEPSSTAAPSEYF